MESQMRATQALYTVFLDHNTSSLKEVPLAPPEGEIKESRKFTTSKSAYTIVKDMSYPVTSLGRQLYYDFSFIKNYPVVGTDALCVRRFEYPEESCEQHDYMEVEFHFKRPS